MYFKKLFFLIFLCSCTTSNFNLDYNKKKKPDIIYSNVGFTLIYDETLIKKKIISKKMSKRSLEIFQKDIKRNKMVKVTNLINNKSIIAVVSSKSKYPSFYNSVISKRIADELDINTMEPYVKILEINNNTTFVAKKSKMFEEEKKVADKAPVIEITINNIGLSAKDSQIETNIKPFNYIIKLGDFYYENSAKILVNKILNEFDYINVKIKKLSQNKHRVFVGPFKNISSLKDAFNDILKLNFENIEIIKL